MLKLLKYCGGGFLCLFYDSLWWFLNFFFIVVMVFIQIQSVTEEKKRLKADLDEAYKRHKEELEIQQLQHFQVNIGGEGENWLKKGKEG